MASVPRQPVVEDGRKPVFDRACVRCGYGVAAGRAPDRCPMCGGTSWRLRTVTAAPEPGDHARPGDVLQDAFLP